MVRRGLLIGLVIAGLGSVSSAQTTGAPDTVLPGRPDVSGEAMALDAPYLSSSAGISVRPPAGGKMIHRAGSGDEIVRFVNDEAKWQMVVSRFLLTEPMPLFTKNADAGQAEKPAIGFVDSILSQMSTGESVRNELVPISGYDGALLATRARDSSGSKLIQHAIVRRSDKIYYVITFTVPITKEKLSDDPKAVSAIETFGKVADSIELLDQQPIARDQTERLLRTRALMVNWNEAKLDAVMVREQWLRLIKDGKDIGYTYIIEEPANDLPRAGKASAAPGKPLGVRVGVRSRTMPSADLVIDAESWLWMSFDRNQESFNNRVTYTEKGKVTDFAKEIGSSIRQDRQVPVVLETPNEQGEKIQGRRNNQYELNVLVNAKNREFPPVSVQLPPFYLPQAAGQLLPRLLPLNEPATYMWASYVSETRNVMTRYVDVMPATTVSLEGKTFTAVPVQERMGLEGSITTHYVSLDGTYRGSVNEENKISIVPSNQAAIRAIWKDANLNRPSDVDEQK